MNELPLHLFTIVHNGMPFIRWHLDQLRQLPFRWTWHVVEGRAQLKHCTAWSVPNGGRLPYQRPEPAPSTDGTSEYLDSIRGAHGNGRVQLHRKCCGKTWDGKIEMVREPLKVITEPCILHQLDADELWTADQFETIHNLFTNYPDKSAARYRCHYFVGPDLVITSLDTYGNHDWEWLRTWRYKPGDDWATHEPPVLVRKSLLRKACDVATINPFTHEVTVAAGLVFQHFAYATRAQLAFKQEYYGYLDAVMRWQCLQQCETFPCKLRDHFDWVKDDAIVDRASNVGIKPLIKLL